MRAKPINKKIKIFFSFCLTYGCECEFCGTTQTIPSADDEKKTNLFNRATQLRRANEFDRAISVYEQLINEFPDEAEAYWGLVLCKYGIEYVDDPLTYRKIPTCHRTSYESIFDDVNYKQAIEKADPVARSVYEDEAKVISDIQKGILRIAKNEKPFDIFICYKETDDAGNRTQDSVLAQELYYQLVNEGFKVFFSRITLEGKLGTQYEPYIFAALNSAKVMVVVGTKPEYFNAVWLKNEWSRFLALMKQDKNKIIIPAYRDMDPYDLPDALSLFQAQDVSKLGFMQDLVRGIKKVAGKGEEKPAQPVVQTVVQQTVPTSSNVENLLKRGMLSLEDGKWDEAYRFFEDVLNENVEEPRAYFGKLMADLKYHTEKDFEISETEFLTNENYNKIQRFGDEALKAKAYEYDLQAIYNQAARMMNNAQTDNQFRTAKDVFLRIAEYKDAQTQADICETAANEYIYTSAMAFVQKAETESKQAYKYSTASNTYLSAVNEFKRIPDYKDSEIKITECTDLAELYRKKYIYYKAESACVKKDEESYKKAIDIMNAIRGFEDVDEKIKLYKQEIQRIFDEQAKQKAAEKAAKDIAIKKAQAARKRKIVISSSVITVIVLGIAFVMLLNKIIIPNSKYSQAGKLVDSGDYEKAISIYTELGEYKDSKDKLISAENESQYINANKYVAKNDIQSLKEAAHIYVNLGEYKDSKQRLIETCYNLAVEEYNSGDYASALTHYTICGNYNNSQEMAVSSGKQATLMQAADYYNKGDYRSALTCAVKVSGATSAKPGVASADQIVEWSESKLYEQTISGKLNRIDVINNLEALADVNYKDSSSRLYNIKYKYIQISGKYESTVRTNTVRYIVSADYKTDYVSITFYYNSAYSSLISEGDCSGQLLSTGGSLGSVVSSRTIKFYNGYLIDNYGNRYNKVS